MDYYEREPGIGLVFDRKNIRDEVLSASPGEKEVGYDCGKYGDVDKNEDWVGLGLFGGRGGLRPFVLIDLEKGRVLVRVRSLPDFERVRGEAACFIVVSRFSRDVH